MTGRTGLGPGSQGGRVREDGYWRGLSGQRCGDRCWVGPGREVGKGRGDWFRNRGGMERAVVLGRSVIVAEGLNVRLWMPMPWVEQD